MAEAAREQAAVAAEPAPAELAPAERTEMRLSGSGGQGVMLAAAIFAEAATALGRHVIQTQSYGPAARGGASKSEVIVSSDEIDYPEVVAPSTTLCLSQESYDAFAGLTADGGMVVYDLGLVKPGPKLEGRHLRGIPFAHLAAEHFKKPMVANIVAVGALVSLTGILPAEAVEESVANRVPPRFRDLNLDAYRLGLEVGRGDVAHGGGRSPDAGVNPVCVPPEQ